VESQIKILEATSQDSAQGRPKRNEKPPTRYGFEDMTPYALTIKHEEPLTYQEAVNDGNYSSWYLAMKRWSLFRRTILGSLFSYLRVKSH